jgi:hypothetical protein
MTLFVNNGKTATELPDTAGDPIPTPTSWGSNTETLAGTKTLVDASETVQYLDPNGVDRDVDLPAPSAVNPFFYIFNTGTLGDLVISQSSGVTVTRLAPGGVVQLISDGTSWSAVVADGIANKLQGILIGGFAGTAQQIQKLHGSSADAGLAAVAVLNLVPIPVDCEATWISGAQNSLDPAGFDVLRNSGGLGPGEDVPGNYQAQKLAGPLAFSAGDVLSLDRTRFSNEARMIMMLRTKVPGHAIQFHSNVSTNALRFLKPGGTADGVAASSVNNVSEYVCLHACTLTSLAFATQIGSGVTFGIYKDGVLQTTLGPVTETVEAWGRRGVVNVGVSVAFAQGDRLAISNDSVQYNNTAVCAFMAGVDAHVYQFCGNTPVINDYYASDRNGAATSGSLATVSFQQTVPQARTVTRVAHSFAAAGTGTIDVIKNGATSESFAPSGTAGVTTGLSTFFDVGDRLALKTNANGNAGQLYVQAE